MNQLHEVVDELLDAGRPYGMGLECGSKGELIACLPQIEDEMLLVCNGVKDRSMLSLILAGQRLGQNIVPVIEKYSEFEHLLGLPTLRASCRRWAFACGSPLAAQAAGPSPAAHVPNSACPCPSSCAWSALEAAGSLEPCCCIATSVAKSSTSKC